jgi:inosine triphosphate pyrophosphatase
MESGGKIPLTFITGNKKKLEEFMSIIVGSPLEEKYEVTNATMDLDELQGTPEFIASRKAKEATNHCDTAVIVEDVGLCFNALKGLPGPYIKDFLGNLGREGLCKML